MSSTKKLTNRQAAALATLRTEVPLYRAHYAGRSAVLYVPLDADGQPMPATAEASPSQTVHQALWRKGCLVQINEGPTCKGYRVDPAAHLIAELMSLGLLPDDARMDVCTTDEGGRIARARTPMGWITAMVQPDGHRDLYVDSCVQNALEIRRLGAAAGFNL